MAVVTQLQIRRSLKSASNYAEWRDAAEAHDRYHKLDRWRSKEGEGLPVDLWIATIPYRETRNYVQAVLSYNVVFQYLQGDPHSLLTPEERQARY